MNYDVFTPIFPVLENSFIRLRAITPDDIPALHKMLQDPLVVQEYWAYPYAPTLEQVRAGYLHNGHVNYLKKQSIMWAIELKATGEVVGVRDLYVDNDYKPLTVQGFIGEKYRRKDISKEAYKLIIDFARRHDAVGLRANTSIENFAAIALLHSVGFAPEYVVFNDDDELRLVVDHNLSDYVPQTFINEEIKRLFVFSKMYLHGEDISITKNSFTRRDGLLFPDYKVSLTGKNTAGPTLYDIYHENLEFISDGTVIMAPSDPEYVSYMDGRSQYVNAWGFCWEMCIK